MNPDELVSVFCEALNEDLESSLQYIATDCVYQNMPFPPVIGPEGVKSTLEGFFQLTGPVRIEILNQVAMGQVVMNERLDYFNPPQGKSFALPVAGVFEVDGALIKGWRDYFCVKQFSEGTGIDF